MGSLRKLGLLLASATLALAGCNSLLGDFTYDPNYTGKSSMGGGPSADEQGNIVVLPAAGLVTTERGGKATFTVSLKIKPTATVVIALSSSNPAEGTVSPISVTFTPENFDAPQMVQVTGVDDTLEDKSQAYVVKTSPATSDDPTYFGLDPLDVQVTNIDDETAGVTFSPPGGLVTTESGGEAMLGIVLNHAPSADVTIGLSSDRPSEGVVSPPSVTFTPTNWMAPQMVTVTGVNDDLVDFEQTYHVVTATIVSADSAYVFDPPDVEVKNLDNDSAGVLLTPAAGLFTGENGDMAMFGVALSSPPKSDVRIPLTSDDPAEGTVSPDSLVFTPLNWMAPQLVTVTGANDDRADGNQPYKILTNPAESDDDGYRGYDGPDADIINIDDDSPSIKATPLTGLVTQENGAATTFTVVLNSKPRGDVMLDVTSSATTEGVVSPAQLVFTEVSWNAPQTVTVTGVDDKVEDGMQPYTVQVTPNLSSADPDYAGLLPVDVQVSNTDDDSAGITVDLKSKPLLTTRESGESDTFTVVLNSQPTADVTIGLTSTDTSEGTVSPAALVFTPDNWSAPQVVTVKGENDDVADGDQRFKINTEDAISTDPKYSGKIVANVDVSNIDDDQAGFTVNPVKDLVTSESGMSASFTVFLNTQPTANVTIPLASTNAGEGTISVASLTFTPSNWRSPQTVTVKGVQDDNSVDGAQVYRIALGQTTSDDGNYNLKDPPDVTLSNLDDDQAGIILRNTNNLTTREDGTSATFQIVLQSRPAQNVQIGLSSTKTAEGTVSPMMLTFTRDNWGAPQTVTVKGVNDDVADGDQPYRITTAAATSADPKYNGLDVADVNVTNLDNDSPGIIVTTPTGGLQTKEPNGTATFTIQLKSQPTADVTVPLRSSKPTEGTVSPASLVFTAANWNSPRTVTLTGVNDDVADGAQPYMIVLDSATSSDGKYNKLDGADVSATNLDDDSPRITVSAPTNDTNESGISASFTIVLGSEPKANVTIPIKSLNTKEGTVSPTSVTFTPLNWKAPQKITVSPVDERVQDGNQEYTIDVGAATSTDDGYQGRDADDVTLTNIDNDTAGILVSAAAGNTSEAGATTTFTIVLTSQPTAMVTIPISSSDVGEGSPNVSSVTFTTTDYNSAKTITVTGADDEEADKDQPYSIVVGAAMSLDANYSTLDAPDVSLKNVDDDSAGFSISAVSGTTSEKATAPKFTFTVALTSKPSESVTIPVSSSDTTEGTVSPSMLVFTTSNWKAVQTVTVSGVNDDVQDGDLDYTVVLGEATSTDAGYAELNPADVAMSNLDDDSAGFDISGASGPTTETGETATFTISLRSKPTGNVTIPISSSDDTEGTVTPASVTFTAADWNQAQTVTVHGENDKQQDGNQRFTIVLGVVTSSDANYKGKNPDDVAFTNVDDDMAGVQLSAVSGPTTEAGGTATFTIVLSSQPSGLVSIPISSNDTTEGTLTDTTVDFTVDNWSKPQTITVQGQDDPDADGDMPYSIVLGKPVTADPNYSQLDPDDVQLSNTDDEPPVTP